MKTSVRVFTVAGLLWAGFAVTASDAYAQREGAGAAPLHQRHFVDPRAQTLGRLMKPISIELQDARLEDALDFIAEVSGAQISYRWADAAVVDGMDREQLVTIKVDNVSLLALLERIIDKAELDEFTQNGWQLTPTGELQVGPKSWLNRFPRLEMYDINDLLYEIPSFTNAPELDLDSVLNQGQGGGGSGSIFDEEDDDESDRKTRREKVTDIITLIQTIVEPDEWVDNGGDAATIREYNGSLIIRAPDYIHREIDGYPFWPQDIRQISAGRRYYSGTVVVQNSSEIPGGGQNPSVTATTGGGP